MSDALRQAVLQVNGTVVDASSERYRWMVRVTYGFKDADLGASAFAQHVTENSHGVITSFQVLGISRSGAEKLYVAKINARVARFKAPSDSRPKIVIATPRVRSRTYAVGDREFDATEVAGQVRQDVINRLSQTGRFAVLDRDFGDEIAAELDHILAGETPPDQLARLRQVLSADLIWVAQIDRLSYPRSAKTLEISDDPLVSYSGGAEMSHRLVNVATRQIVFSDSASTTLPTLGPTTLPLQVDSGEKLGRLREGLASQVVAEIVTSAFPVSVVRRSGDSVVLSQGGGTLREHATYQVVFMGEEATDPQTGQSLGRIEQPCCLVYIDRVTPTMSYGTLREVRMNLDGTSPTALQVREMKSHKAP